VTSPAPPAVGEERGSGQSLTRQKRSVASTIARVVVPLLIITGALLTYFDGASYWTRFRGLCLAFTTLAYVAVMARGRFRDAAAMIASFALALAAVEGYFVEHYRTTIDTNTPGYSVYNPVLGWGPAHPGVYHHHKVDAKTGRVILDTDYTIDAHLTRKVDSAADAPTIAIAGGSTTFGSGIADSATLPQAFADAIGRRLHVVNLAFSGYGGQQFLRILETGLHDDVLTRMRAFVFVSQLEYADRAACGLGYTLPGPRYELVDGKATFVGSCAEEWSLPLRWLFEITSLYDIIAPRFDKTTLRQKVDLYIAILIRAGQIAREKYGVPTIIFYMPAADDAQRGGYTAAEVADRLRAGGLIVVDGTLDLSAFPGQELFIPGDGHPTGVANREWARQLVTGLTGVISLGP
jgi:hypothetical protein